ncbi:MAG: hypothetical protein GY741_16685 [Phycisphaeraceae bacterium]|nr:hypothetical protein [Phycisphaeraceae bacterium]
MSDSLRNVLTMLLVSLGSAVAAADEDCNGNGISDRKDIAVGRSADCQMDGIPDECQLAVAETTLSVVDGIYEGAVGSDFLGSIAWLTGFKIEPGQEVLTGVRIGYGLMPEGFPVNIGIWSDPNGDGDPADAILIESIQTPVESPWLPVTIIDVEFPETMIGDSGESVFLGAWVDSLPGAPDAFPATYDAAAVAGTSWWITRFDAIDPDDLAADAVEFGLISEIIPGFQGDWLLEGTFCPTGHCGESSDIDENGVPDECDPDCDGNGIPDDLDLENGAPDCNGNGIIDSCETLEDCDENGIPDECQREIGNLLAEYFPNPDLAGPGIARLDPGVFFDFGAPGARPAGIPANDFSAIWTGTITAPVTGAYEIGLRHDDGVRLFIDGDLRIDRWGPSGGDLDVVTEQWMEGEPHFIRIEYYQGAGNALLEFVQRTDGLGDLTPVPAEWLSPSVDIDGDGQNEVCDVPDCNANRVPDVIEIAQGGDCDGDGTLDACQAIDDCNGNGIVDACEEDAAEGLFAEYYSSEGGTGTFTNRVVATIDQQVDFAWGDGAPYDLPPDDFSVAWSGSIRTTGVGGIYEFLIQVDDGVRFWVDGELLIDVWEPNFKTQSVAVELESDRVYPVRLEMFELGGGAECRLSWTPPGGPTEIVPASNLVPFPDRDQDGIDDRCAGDCNGDGISDALEIASGAPDCNGNGVPDDCDLAISGVAPSVAWWRFEGDGDLATDSGPNGLAGALTNASRSMDVPLGTIPLTGDANAGGLTLGSNASMAVDDPTAVLALGNDAFTIEAWIRLEELADASGNGQRQWLACRKPAGGDQRIDWGVLVQGGNYPDSCRVVYGGPTVRTGRELVFTAGDGTGDSTRKWSVVSTLRIEDDAWHHVAVSVDLLGRRVRFVLDDRIEDVEIGERAFPAGEGPLRIGCHVNASGTLNQFLRGSIDELRIRTGHARPDRLLDFPYLPVSIDENGDSVPDECLPDCPGDFDASGIVGGEDLGELLGQFGLTGKGLSADLNGDGIVDGADLGLLFSLWGTCG